jgi:probable blue pigment (indigoidine) exporter
LMAFTGWQLTVGGLLLAPMTLAVEGLPAGLSGVNVGGFAYLALVNTAVGYALWFRGLERLPAARVSFLGLLSPVVAAVAGWLVLDQSLTRWQLLGVALALGSLVAAQRTSTRYAPASRGSTSPMPTPSVRSATDLGLRGRPALDT